MTFKLLTVWRSLCDKVRGNPYKRRLAEALVAVDKDPAPASLSFSRIHDLNHTIETELAEARREASALLEQVVERSMSERRRLGIIFDSLDDAVLIVQSDGVIVDVSGKARQIFQMTTDEFKAKHLCQLFMDADAESILAWESTNYFKFLQDNGCKLNCNTCDKSIEDCGLRDLYAEYVRKESKVLNRQMYFDFTRSDGTVISVQVVVNILTLDITRLEDICFIAVVRDLTTQNQVKAEALRLQSYNYGLMSVTPVPMFYKGSDLKFTGINKSFRDLLDLTDDEVVGKSVHQVFDAVSAGKLHDLDQATLSSTLPQQLALDLKTVKGLVRAANIFSRVVKINDSDSGVAGSIVIEEDVDANMRSAIFAAAAKAICFVDVAQIITGCNDEFLRLTGNVKHSVVGMKTTDSAVAQFFHQKPVGTFSDVITVNDTVVNRLCVPLVRDQGRQDSGTVYIYFVHLDKTEDIK